MATGRWRWAGLASGLVLVGLVAAGIFAAAVQAEEPPPPGDPLKGKADWNRSCALCHGANGEGVVGPPLAGLAGHMERIAQLPGGLEGGLKTIRNGIPNRMPAFP
ncbi:MAG: cytochrome c, partial [Dehalococcoidia bacterium]|nr:cytochrome c [Dehalococcoidia bacterium]